MTLQPLLEVPWAVQAHVVTLIAAWLVGTWMLFVGRKGTSAHRRMGALFIALMLITAAISLFIHYRMPNPLLFGFSTFHLFVPLVVCLSAIALYGGLSGRRSLHRFGVMALYFGSITFTGVVNVFLGTGVAHRVFFS